MSLVSGLVDGPACAIGHAEAAAGSEVEVFMKVLGIEERVRSSGRGTLWPGAGVWERMGILFRGLRSEVSRSSESQAGGVAGPWCMGHPGGGDAPWSEEEDCPSLCFEGGSTGVETELPMLKVEACWLPSLLVC